MSVTLDCEDYNSAIKCLADAHGAKLAEVEAFLSSLDLEGHYRTKGVTVRGDEYLAGLFQTQFGGPIHVWDKICWFHLTRVPGTDFAEGILPLGLALERIWATVISIQDDSRKKAILATLETRAFPTTNTT